MRDSESDRKTQQEKQRDRQSNRDRYIDRQHRWITCISTCRHQARRSQLPWVSCHVTRTGCHQKAQRGSHPTSHLPPIPPPATLFPSHTSLARRVLIENFLRDNLIMATTATARECFHKGCTQQFLSGWRSIQPDRHRGSLRRSPDLHRR